MSSLLTGGLRRVYYALVAGGRTLLRETRADVLALPGFIAVVLLAVVIRELFGHPPNRPIILSVFAGVIILDVFFARFLLRTGRATFVVTAEDITFTPRQGKDFGQSPPQVIRRTAGSTLSFRLQDNGFVGGQIQYRLKLRDDATGDEVSAVPFGRIKVRRACESQGWPFS